MNDLDQTIRAGLREATDGVDGVDPVELAHRLERRRASPQHPQVSPTRPHPRRLLAVGAAAAVLLLAVGAAALWAGSNDRSAHQDVVADDPQSTVGSTSTTGAPVSVEQPSPVTAAPAPSTPVDEWAPGWYQVDLASLPATTATPVWFDGDLVITATPAAEFAGGTQVFRRDQLSGAWSELPRLPLTNAAVVAAGDRLVAVGMQGYRMPPLPPAWAILSDDASEWLLQGEARSEASVAMENYMGPMLVWTGERVVDVADAVVLDPATGRAQALEMPDETELSWVAQRAVWTGDRLVVPRWDHPGWAWDQGGRYLGEVPAAAAEASSSAPTGDRPGDGAAAAIDGAVLLTAGPPVSGGSVARRLPSEASQWEDAAAPPVAPVPADVDTFAQCRPWLGAAGQQLLSLACNAGGFRSAELADGRWTPIGVPEVVSSSQIVGVLDARDHVVVSLEVPPPAGAFASPSPAMLIWVPER